MFKETEKEEKEKTIEEQTVEERIEKEEIVTKQEITLEAVSDLIQISILKVLSEMYIPIRIAEKKDQDKVLYYGNFVTKEDMMKIAKEHGYIK